MKPKSTPWPMAYRVIERDGESVVLHPEFGETIPCHSDMLRYDMGFCDPNQVDQVVFPVFRSKNGKAPLAITRDRWYSFGLLVEGLEKHEVRDVGSWTTYRHADEDAMRELVPVTLDEWLKQHPGEKIAEWR